MKLLTVQQMLEAEKTADQQGHSYATMMENAGKQLAEAIMQRVDVDGKSVLMLVGPGNNGGDGLVAGRYLAEAGADVAFYLLKPRDPDADENLAKVQAMGLLILNAEFDQRYRVLRTRLNITDIFIDALLGTGISRPIKGDLAKLMQQVKNGIEEARGRGGEGARGRGGDRAQSSRHHAITPSPHHSHTHTPIHPYIVAVDCPSGLNCNTGALDELAISADLTVTFAAPKWGHFLFPGAGALGELVVVDIRIDPTLPALAEVQVEVVTEEMARGLLPKRPLNGHKGTFGKLAIAAGCEQYRGAPILAARGAFRAGAGLVSLYVPSTLRDVATTNLPEATYPIVSEDKVLGEEAAEQLLNNLERYSAILVGPGLGEAMGFLRPFLTTLRDKENAPPLVVDADGLNLLAQMEDWHTMLPPNSILTPHPAEMARLMGIELPELLEQNRIELARDCARKWRHIVLLKGAHTVIAAPDGRVRVLPFANPVLAVGGSGDVLSGVMVALLSVGMDGMETAVLAAYLHAATSTQTTWQSGLLASEIADLVPEIMQQLREIGD